MRCIAIFTCVRHTAAMRPTGRLRAAIVIYSAVLGSPLVGLFSIANRVSRNSCEIVQESDDVVSEVGFGPHVLDSRR